MHRCPARECRAPDCRSQRHRSPARHPARSTTRDPIRSWTHRRVVIAVVVGRQRLGLQRGVGQLLGGRAIVDALEPNEPSLLLLARLDDGQPLGPGEQSGARRHPLEPIGDQRDVQLALNTVGTTDAPDFAESRQSSVDKVDVDLDAIAGGRGAHDGADALRSAPTPADDPAEIARADLDLELQTIPALDGIDLHSICVVDDRTDDVGEHCRRSRRGTLRRRGSGGRTAASAPARRSRLRLDCVLRLTRPGCLTGRSSADRSSGWSVAGWSVTWLPGRR